MAIEIDQLQKEPDGGFYISPARLCVTANDEVCACDDPAAVKLLVGEGGALQNEDARRYGLLVDRLETKPLRGKKGKAEPDPDAE